MVLSTMSMSADTYNYLNFVTANNQTTQFATDGFRMTFNNGIGSVTVNGQTRTVNLASMAYMEFSNTSTGGSDYLPGDVNGDGTVDIADVNIVINIMLGMDSADKYDGRAYITSDDIVDIADVNAAINIMLGM